MRTTKATPTRSAMAAILVVFALLAGACGGDDASSGGDQALIEAIATQMAAGGGVPPGADLDCMARATVEGLGGAQAMEERFGLTVESVTAGTDASEIEVPQAEAVSLADGFMDCGLLDLMGEFVAGAGVTDEQSQCIIDNLDEAAFRDSLAAEFMSDAEGAALSVSADERVNASMTEAATNCVVGS